MSALGLTAATIAVLTLLSAFFSASETSLTSISRLTLRQLKKSRAGADRRLVRLVADRSRVITSILIGNNLVNNAAASVATAFSIDLFGSEGVAIATAAMTVILLIFGEITPKNVASRFPVPLLRAFAPVIGFFQALFTPAAIAFSSINGVFITALKRLSPDSAHRLTEEEIRAMVDLGQKDGAIEDREHGLMQRAFDFGTLRVREIMTSRTEIVGLRSDDGEQAIRKAFRSAPYSRMPVFSGSEDTVSGILHFKDLAGIGAAPANTGPGSVAAEALARPALFVPETQTVPKLLAQLDRERQHMAIVVDERGITAGLITIDDAIAAIFGSLGARTKNGDPSRLVQVLSPEHLKIPGNLRLDDFNALVKTSLDSEYYETVGGYLLERLGHLPVAGERFETGDFCMVVEETAERAVRRIDVRLINAH